MISRIAVVGPTATGKTSLAVRLAREWDGELVNADSRQVLRHVAVGTAKPTTAELQGIPCHATDLRNPGEEYTVSDWLRAARQADDDIAARGKMTVLVGGTGLYVTSFIQGFRAREQSLDPALRLQRNAVAERGGLGELVDELAKRDPEAFATIDTQNPRRVIRALELLDQGFKTLAEAHTREDARPALLLGIDWPGEEHRRRIEIRVTGMFDGGLADEVRALREAGIQDDDIAAAGIGYSEAIQWLDSALSREEAVAATVRRTLQYATSQRTWWRKQPGILWLEAKHTFAHDPKK